MDNDQLDPVGYLRYAVTLAWPKADAAPQTCARSDEIQAAILEALTPAAGPLPRCETVTWVQLATIRTLGQPEQPDRDPVRVIHTHDLAGLSGLEDTSLFFAGPRLQPDFLAPVPRLRRLWLKTTPFLEPMPTGVFNSVPLPALTHLTVEAEGLQTLPVDWLMHLPGLTHLHLDLQNLRELSPGWLPDLPGLTHLHLDLYNLRELSPGWLPPLPGLTHLDLYNLRELSPGWLPDLPTLTHLEMVWSSSGQSIHTADGRWVYESLKALPADWLPSLPALTHLRLESPHLTFLLPGGLRSVPALTDLEVVGAAIDYMPTEWLRSVPALTSLRLQAPLRRSDFELPPALPALTYLEKHTMGFFPPIAEWVPQLSALTHLDLGYHRYRWGSFPLLPTLIHLALTAASWEEGQGPSAIPALPALTHMQLYMGSLEALGPDWRPNWPALPALTHLELVLPPLERLPPDWLPLWPTLTHLSLEAEHLRSLDSGWLPDLPALTHLALDVAGDRTRWDRSRLLRGGYHAERILSLEDLGAFTTLSPNFLAAIPGLTHLALYADGLTTWPAGLLRPVPGLTHLTLYADGLTTWPAGLLHPVPGLTHVALDVDGLTTLPPDFLAHAPDLTQLFLYADNLSALPDPFLVSAARLQELGLYANGVAEMPPAFLSSAPRLRKVYLWAASLSGVSRDFLRNVSHEVQFNWEGVRWQRPPDYFWVHLWDLNWSDDYDGYHDGHLNLPVSYYWGPHVTTTTPVVNLRDRPSLTQGQVVGQVDEPFRRRFPAIDRHVDPTGRMWLRLWHPSGPPVVEQDAEEIWIAADYVALLDPYQLSQCQAADD